MQDDNEVSSAHTIDNRVVSVIERCRMHCREECDECFDWKARARAAEADAAHWKRRALIAEKHGRDA